MSVCRHELGGFNPPTAPPPTIPTLIIAVADSHEYVKPFSLTCITRNM